MEYFTPLIALYAASYWWLAGSKARPTSRDRPYGIPVVTCAYMPTICLCVMHVCVRLALTMCEFQDFPDVRVDLCSDLCASISILTVRNLDYYILFDLENALNP